MGARQLIQAANFNRFQKAGLSATQFMTLNLLPTSEHGLTLTELAHAMNLSAATVTKTIDSLEARGLLTRTKSDQDRRQVLIALTAGGKTLHNAASLEFHQHMATLFRAIDAGQRRGLIEGLEALVRAGRPSAGGAGKASAAVPGPSPQRLSDSGLVEANRAADAGPRGKRNVRRPRNP